MRFCWATDVHFNFMDQSGVERFCETVGGSGASALLLGGDIAEATDLLWWLGFLDARIDLPVYFVLGNHDYYKGTIRGVRRLVENLRFKRLIWLPSAGSIDLGAGVGLVGHGGWGDARYGDFDHSPVILSDYLLIEDLRDTV
ncbi:MAG: metallophosphoesterase, partial [bacterium]